MIIVVGGEMSGVREKQKPNHRVRLSSLLTSILIIRPVSRLVFLTY